MDYLIKFMVLQCLNPIFKIRLLDSLPLKKKKEMPQEN